MIIPKPENIDIEFTDAKLTGMAGSLFIARIANQLKLPERLKEHIRLKNVIVAVMTKTLFSG